MASNLPAPLLGGVPVPRSVQMARIDRAVNRYQAETFVAAEKERLDQVAHGEVTRFALGLGCQLIDEARFLAGDDPMKQQLAVLLVSNWADVTVARTTRRFGGVA